MPHAVLPAQGVSTSPAEATSYAQVPWYRRSSVNTAFIIIGFLTKGYLPLALVTCVLVLTGDVYYKEKDQHGALRKWSKANKFAAIILLALNAWLLWYVLREH